MCSRQDCKSKKGFGRNPAVAMLHLHSLTHLHRTYTYARMHPDNNIPCSCTGTQQAALYDCRLMSEKKAGKLQLFSLQAEHPPATPQA